MRIVIAAVLALLSVAPGAVRADPAGRTRDLAETMKTVASAPAGGRLTPGQEAANCKVYLSLDGYFDYDRIIDQALVSVKDSLSAKESAEFTATFRELIRMIAYPDSGKFFRRAKWSVAPAKAQGDKAMVDMETSAEEEDYRSTVRYTWSRQGDTWRITDVAFDGASLVKDYQNQFKRIVEKEGAAGLMKRLQAKSSDEKAKRLVCGK
jgi:phospholipid transport system substrate-binding protein